MCFKRMRGTLCREFGGHQATEDVDANRVWTFMGYTKCREATIYNKAVGQCAMRTMSVCEGIDYKLCNACAARLHQGQQAQQQLQLAQHQATHAHQQFQAAHQEFFHAHQQAQVAHQQAQVAHQQALQAHQQARQAHQQAAQAQQQTQQAQQQAQQGWAARWRAIWRRHGR